MPVSACGSVVVDIVGYPVRFTADHVPLLRLLQDRYRNFLTPSADPVLQFDVDVLPAPPGDADADLSVQGSGGRWRMARGDFDAEWDGRTRRGRIRQTLNPYSTDSVLRIVHSLLLCGDRGFLLHASSVVLDGRAFLFTGPSGAGKTTIARLAPAGAVLLTDEISCVRRTTDGWMAYGTPFAGELGTSGDRVSAPIAAMYRLEQGLKNHVDALSPGEAVRTLMRNILFFARDAACEASVLDTVCELTSEVPMARLIFTPGPDVWTAIGSHPTFGARLSRAPDAC
jgi:hypothetical protein